MSSVKKAYSTMRLTKLGDFSHMTLGQLGSRNDGGGSPGFNQGNNGQGSGQGGGQPNPDNNFGGPFPPL